MARYGKGSGRAMPRATKSKGGKKPPRPKKTK